MPVVIKQCTLFEAVSGAKRGRAIGQAPHGHRDDYDQLPFCTEKCIQKPRLTRGFKNSKHSNPLADIQIRCASPG